MALYIKYLEGAKFAASIYSLKGNSGKGIKSVTSSNVAKSHLLNAQKPPTPLNVNNVQLEQEGRAESLAQNAMNHALKLGLDSAALCSSCKKTKHYGNCKKQETGEGESPLILTKIKAADFNFGMTGSDGPETRPRSYTQGTGYSGRSQGQVNVDPKLTAASAPREFRKVLEPLIADDWTNAYGALNKTAILNTPIEHRGPTVNPYEQRNQRLRPITLDQMTKRDQIGSMFRSFDIPSDAAGIDTATPMDEVLV